MDKYERQLAAIDRQIREAVGLAKAVTEYAAGEGRGMTEDEDAKLKGHLATVATLKEQRTEIAAAVATRDQIKALGNEITEVIDAPREDTRRRAKSIGEALVESEGYKAMLAGGLSGRWSSGAVEMEGKALLDSTAVGSDATGLIQPDVQPGILPTLFQPLTVASLMASGQTNSSLVRYLVETVATNGAAGVAESGSKPESALEFDAVDEPVKKLATFLPVTDEMIEDVAALQSYVNGRLSLFVRQEEERQLLSGNGGDEIVGILNRDNVDAAPSSGADFANAADEILSGITAIRMAFLEADAVVMNPLDWEGVATLKDQQGRYIGSNPFQGEQSPRIWGKPVVVTQAIEQGTALVGAFAAASQIFRKGGLSVEASNSHADFFQHNKTAIRCEERLALAVYRPQAFKTVDVSGS